MRATLTILAALATMAGSASAGDIYVTRDAQGKPVYTDTPQAIPAERLKVHSSSTDPAEVQARYDEQMKRYSADDDARAKSAATTADAKKAAALSAEDKAQRCGEARNRYAAVMQSYRLYEESPEGERRYLSNEEIDLARADAKKVMDEFCGAQ
jgi:hypothetical protein